MDPKTLASFQQVLTAGAGIAVAFGVMNPEQANTIVTDVVVILGAGVGLASAISAIIQAHKAKKVEVAANAAGVSVADVKTSPLRVSADLGAQANQSPANQKN